MKMIPQVTCRFKANFVPGVLLAVGFLLFGISSLPAHGQDLGVSVSPKRVVFEGRQRNVEVTLLNKSNKAVTYRVFFKNMRMKEDGSFEIIESAQVNEKFSEPLIRYSPRQITVPARGSQSVRLLLRKPRDLPPGEYRSHLFFQSLPPPDTGKDINSDSSGKGELKIQLVAILSLSIPIIVRNGDLSADVELSNLVFKSAEAENVLPTLSADLNRKGDRSVFGDVHVIFKPAQGPHLTLAEMKGLSVYTPNPTRKLEIPLTIPDKQQLQHGNLYVFYREPEDAGGAILAKAKMPVP